MKYEVIESKAWIHALTGQTASIYGASPWFYMADRPNWSIVSRGWTVRDNVNNTVGIGRVPWANRDEAQAWADEENERLTRAYARYTEEPRTTTPVRRTTTPVRRTSKRKVA